MCTKPPPSPYATASPLPLHVTVSTASPSASTCAAVSIVPADASNSAVAPDGDAKNRLVSIVGWNASAVVPARKLMCVSGLACARTSNTLTFVSGRSPSFPNPHVASRCPLVAMPVTAPACACTRGAVPSRGRSSPPPADEHVLGSMRRRDPSACPTATRPRLSPVLTTVTPGAGAACSATGDGACFTSEYVAILSRASASTAPVDQPTYTAPW